jgi:hypothetical protein
MAQIGKAFRIYFFDILFMNSIWALLLFTLTHKQCLKIEDKKIKTQKRQIINIPTWVEFEGEGEVGGGVNGGGLEGSGN